MSYLDPINYSYFFLFMGTMPTFDVQLWSMIGEIIRNTYIDKPLLYAVKINRLALIFSINRDAVSMVFCDFRVSY